MEFQSKKIKVESKLARNTKQVTRKIVETAKEMKMPKLPAISGGAVQNLRYIIATLGALLVIFIAVQGYSFIRNLNFDFSITNIVNNLFGEDLKTDRFGRTNVLLLAVGGGAHDGADLTDSIMVASFDHAKKTVSLLSIPRDLYVKFAPGYFQKINAVYDYFSRKFGKEDGLIQMENMIKNITGLEVQYYAKINFQGFKEVVDILGGVDIDVPEAIVDTKYPVEDNNGAFIRNELFQVEQGLQHMDGEMALKYARTRHAPGADFSRTRRQQQVLVAIRDKALKENYLGNPSALKRLYYAVSSNLETDVNINEAIRAAFILKDLDRGRIISAGLSDDPTKLGGFLYTPNRELTGGASALLPDTATAANPESYTTIRRFADMLTSSQEVFLEKARIRISNGTKVGGLGKTLQDELGRFGFNVVEIGNTANKTQFDATQIILYSPTIGHATVENLQTFVSGQVVERFSAASNDNENAAETPDIEIIIGKDYGKYL